MLAAYSLSPSSFVSKDFVTVTACFAEDWVIKLDMQDIWKWYPGFFPFKIFAAEFEYGARILQKYLYLNIGCFFKVYEFQTPKFEASYSF